MFAANELPALVVITKELPDAVKLFTPEMAALAAKEIIPLAPTVNTATLLPPP